MKYEIKRNKKRNLKLEIRNQKSEILRTEKFNKYNKQIDNSIFKI